MASKSLAQTKPQIEEADLATTLTQAIKALTAGIAPYAGGEESEEYRENVPLYLRSKKGLPADEVAQLLASERPELGITDEASLFKALDMAQRQRREHGKQASFERPEAPRASGTFDVDAAREAVGDFAYYVNQLDQQVIDQLRLIWTEASRRAGHKALARYIVTGNIALACKSFDKMAARA